MIKENSRPPRRPDEFLNRVADCGCAIYRATGHRVSASTHGKAGGHVIWSCHLTPSTVRQAKRVGSNARSSRQKETKPQARKQIGKQTRKPRILNFVYDMNAMRVTAPFNSSAHVALSKAASDRGLHPELLVKYLGCCWLERKGYLDPTRRGRTAGGSAMHLRGGKAHERIKLPTPAAG